jgi:RTA1 like protein
MIAGSVFQVFSLALFEGFSGEIAWRLCKAGAEIESPSKSEAKRQIAGRFVRALMACYFLIFIRCVYRIIWVSSSWEAALIQNETDFVVLEVVLRLNFALVSYPVSSWGTEGC